MHRLLQISVSGIKSLFSRFQGMKHGYPYLFGRLFIYSWRVFFLISTVDYWWVDWRYVELDQFKLVLHPCRCCWRILTEVPLENLRAPWIAPTRNAILQATRLSRPWALYM